MYFNRETSITSIQKKKTLYLPMSGNGSTISQFGTDLKNMATFCMAISVIRNQKSNSINKYVTHYFQ